MTLGPAPKDLLGCAIPGCTRDLRSRGLCDRHYQEAYRNQTLPPLRREMGVRKVEVKTHVPAELEAAVRFLSRKTGRTRSDILRMALEQFVKTSQ